MRFTNLLLLLTVSPAFAQDFFGAGVSAQTASRAGIYVPDSGNVLDALSVNPAGLSAVHRIAVNLSATGLLARGSFSNAVNSNSPMRFTAGAIPYGAAGFAFGKRWTVAAGFLPDLLSSANWQFRDSLYGPQNEKSQILAYRSAAAVSYSVSSRVSVGVSASAIYNANTLVMPYVFQSNPSLAGLKTLLDLHTHGFGWNTAFGITARPASHWEIGAAYRTRSAIVSNGTATGNMGAQFTALGIPFQPAFAYRAQVRVEIPQSALLNAGWQATPVLRLSFQTDWTNWNRSFSSLPVTLTNGTNPDINSFLGTNGIKDVIPLNWKDQVSFRISAERKLRESATVSAGYVHRNNPVPSSTLSPLTAAIMGNGLSAGLGYTRGIARFDLAYQFNLTAHQSVGTSALLSGDFSRSRLNVGTQALILSTSFHL